MSQLADKMKVIARNNLTHRYVGIKFKRPESDNVRPHEDIAKQYMAKFASGGPDSAKVLHHIYKVPSNNIKPFKDAVRSTFPKHKVNTIKKY